MKEANVLVVGAGLRFFTQELKPGRSEPIHCGGEIFHFKCQVVQSFAVTVEKLMDRRIGAEGFEKFELRSVSV